MVRKIDIEELKKLLNDTDSSLVTVARSFLEDIVAEHEEPSRGELYNKGLNDAWEFVCKILEKTDAEIKEVFLDENAIYPFKILFRTVSPQEALAKLKAYEEQSKIKVGDVVKDKYDDKGVVLDETESYYSVFTESGYVQEWLKAICKKTGKHIDIQSILEQIGGE